MISCLSVFCMTRGLFATLLLLFNVVFAGGTAENKRLKLLSFGGNGNIGSSVLSQLIQTERNRRLLVLLSIHFK
jgi:hypothetical protein